MSSELLVSICMITYNHLEYIKEAVEGILEQDVDFDVEIIIADDSSSEDISEIIQFLIQTHKNGSWIKYYKHSKNKGMIGNFQWALKQCQGKYIALCEGDDFWIDNKNLSKKIEFLEKNINYSAVASKSKVKNEILNLESEFSKYTYSIITLDLILKTGNIIATNTLVFRNYFLDARINFYDSPYGDYFLLIKLLQKGNIYFMNEITGVYRISLKGVHGNLAFQKSKTHIIYRRDMFFWINIYVNNVCIDEIVLRNLKKSYILYNNVLKDINILIFFWNKVVYKMRLFSLLK